MRRPTKDELEAARSRTIPDVLAPDLDVLFCGINPGLYSAATGCHFARPGNRFWPALAAAEFTPRTLEPSEQGELLKHGFGVTNLVARPTARAEELTPGELRLGGERLAELVGAYTPRIVAIVGISAYRTAFGRPKARIGPQQDKIAAAVLWVLPNPSGLNAHWPMESLAGEFYKLRKAAAVPSVDQHSC